MAAATETWWDEVEGNEKDLNSGVWRRGGGIIPGGKTSHITRQAGVHLLTWTFTIAAAHCSYGELS